MTDPKKPLLPPLPDLPAWPPAPPPVLPQAPAVAVPTALSSAELPAAPPPAPAPAPAEAEAALASAKAMVELTGAVTEVMAAGAELPVAVATLKELLAALER